MSDFLQLLGSISIVEFLQTFVVAATLAGLSNLILNNLSRRKQHSSYAIMTKVLDHAILTISRNHDYEIRANIFMPQKDDKHKLKIRYYSSNMSSAPDLGLTLEKWQGCTGQAWGYEAPVVGDLTLTSEAGGTEWGLSEKQKELTKPIITILSYPIRHPKNTDKVIAILNFDSFMSIAKYFSSPDVQKSVSLIAAEIALILLALDAVE
jgi:hypothetical protein